MKSERRHELQHNMLAEWLITTYTQIKPYQNAILGVVVLLLVAVAGYKWWSVYSANRNTEAWEAVDKAMKGPNGAEMEKVLTQHPASSAAPWAAIQAGESYHHSALEALLSDKETAGKELSKAVELYQNALKDANSPMISQRATFDLARALESQAVTVEPKESQGKLDEAARYYKQVRDQWPNGLYADEATKRLKDLETAATQSRYEQLALYTPPQSPAPDAAKDSTGTKTPSATPGSGLLGPLLDNPPSDPALSYEPLKVLRGTGTGGAESKEPPKPAPEAKTDAKTTASPSEKPWAKTIPPPPEAPAEKTPAEKTPEKPAEPGK